MEELIEEYAQKFRENEEKLKELKWALEEIFDDDVESDEESDSDFELNDLEQEELNNLVDRFFIYSWIAVFKKEL